MAVTTRRKTAETNGHINRVAGELNGVGESRPIETKIKEGVKLYIPELKTGLLEATVKGITPLVIRAWDQKTAQMLADKQMGKKQAKSREAEVPEDTYNGAKYFSTEGWEGLPATAFKAALVDAVSCLDISRSDFNMTLAKKVFFVKPEGVCRASGRDLIRIHGKSEVYKIMQPTSGGGPYMSYRPMYRNWSCNVRVQFNAAKIDSQGVLNLLATAGFYCGVGEHRPSAKESKTGTFGRWEVQEKGGK